jgi:cytochrome c-type biogenesis protein CcmH/NrfG
MTDDPGWRVDQLLTSDLAIRVGPLAIGAFGLIFTLFGYLLQRAKYHQIDMRDSAYNTLLKENQRKDRLIEQLRRKVREQPDYDELEDDL